MKAFLTILLICLLSGIAEAQSLKRMLKLLEKQEFEQAEMLIKKAYEKDSIHTAAYYAHALLFLDRNFNRYNIDSTYIYLGNASRDLEVTDPKIVTRLEKSNLNIRTLDSLKIHVEGLGYGRATGLNNVEDYQYFIDFFPESNRIGEAVENRNALAFEIAKRKNTYEGYSYFLITYPEARQVIEAKELYDIRLFQEKTGDGSLESYKKFIIEFPGSPFRNEAEKQIFEKMTAANQAENYLEFLKDIDHRYYSRRAVDFLYHNNPGNFLRWKDDPGIPEEVLDSLEIAHSLSREFLIPYYEVSKYGFMNEQGAVVLEKYYEKLEQVYICEGLKGDIIISGSNGESAVFGRNGHLIFKGDIKSLNVLELGIMEIRTEEENILVHKGGYRILSGNWDEVKILASSFISIKENDTWKLYLLTGKRIDEKSVEGLIPFYDLIITKSENRWSISTIEELIEKRTRIEYDELEVEDDYILAIKNDKIFIIDSLGNLMIEQGFMDISNRYNSWILKTGVQKTLILGNSFDQPIYAEDFISNEKFILAKKDDNWSLISNSDSLIYNLKEPRFFGRQFLIASRTDSLLLFFHPDSSAIYLEGSFPELIRNAGESIDDKPIEFVLLVDGYKNKLISSEGRIVDNLDKYENFTLHGNEYIITERKGKKGILDLNGEQLLASGYDGIGNYTNGTLALLLKGKFGCYRFFPSVMILPEYDIVPEEINENIFKARKDGLYGLLSKEGEVLMEFNYDDIHEWRDSLVLVKADFRWKVINAYTQEVSVEDIKDFKMLKGGEESILKILTGTGYGIISNQRGIIVPPVYSDLHYFLNDGYYTFFCEKNIEEASFYVLIYIDHSGNIIKKQAFEEEDYKMIYCESD